MNWSDNEILRSREQARSRPARTLLFAAVCVGALIVLAIVMRSPQLPYATAADEVQGGTTIRVAFNADCEKMLVGEINRAEREVLVAIYNITRRSITSALAKAVTRGVTVQVKYDAGSYADSTGMKEAIDFLERKGVKCTPIKFAKTEKEGRMHNKFSVIDEKLVLTGSYNYTSSASTENYENLVLIESPEVAKRYIEEFGKIKSK